MIKAFSPAKINLFLHVTGKRDDGYHELYTLMTCLDFGDDLEFEFKGSGVTVVCDHPDVPEDDSNLVCRAAVLFMDSYLKLGVDAKKEFGLCITIHKQIPVGAGLGGGSSNAATTLKVLNQKFDQPFTQQELLNMGLTLGADLPFFIHGYPAFARGVGEKLFPCPPLKPYHVVVYFPGFSVRTSLVYENFNFALTNEKKTNNNALLNMSDLNKVLDVKGLLHNDLEPSACRLYPELVQVRKLLADYRPDGMLMAGSGSSYFVLFSDASRANGAFTALGREVKDNQERVFMASF